MLIARASESTFKPVSPGMHLARCYRVIDLGTQESAYQGKVKYLHKAMIQWEVHSEDEDGNPLKTDKGEPMSISKTYTVSLGESSALRRDLVAWRGREFTSQELRGFELKNILGAWCMISVVATERDGKTYTNIAAVMPVPANIKKAGLPEGHNEAQMFSISNPDMELFESFSKFLQEKISSSPEWQSRQKQVTPVFTGDALDIEDDKIPF